MPGETEEQRAARVQVERMQREVAEREAEVAEREAHVQQLEARLRRVGGGGSGW